MKSLLTITALLLSFFSYANVPSKKKLAAQFYKNLLSPSLTKPLPPNQCEPRPDIGSCVKSFCDRLYPFGCDNEEKLKNVVGACRGNFGGSCIDSTCNNISSMQCDDFDELALIAQSCSGVYDNSCSTFFTSHLFSLQHDDRDEMVNINNQCKNIFSEVTQCAQYVCDKLSKSSCDDFDELANTIKTCSGL